MQNHLMNKERLSILVVGSGGREHAIIAALKEDPRVAALYALPGNGGIKQAVCLPIDPMDNQAVVQAALEHRVDFCVVSSDDPLANGLVDALEKVGVACFGPNQAAALIESSKAFSKKLMQENGIPTAAFLQVDDLKEGLRALSRFSFPVVIKADGLAKGKGVLIAQNQEEAEEALRLIFETGAFGSAGNCAIMEEFLTGPEVSVLVFTDGENLVELPSAMDHKRAGEGDTGLNTGGMGVVAPNPSYTPDIARRCMEEIYLPTLRAMRERGTPFRGCLFFGLMLTEQGPKVLEYNARPGDPETQVVFTLLKNSPLDAFLHCRFGGLKEGDLRFYEGAAAGVVVASQGYPGQVKTGDVLTEPSNKTGLYYAGVKRVGEGLVTSGGRVATACARGDSLKDALNKAYALADSLRFQGAWMRRDIGRKALRLEEQA